MADRNHPNIADPVDLAEDDPFAELTRIMGFDPRQPVKPAASGEIQQSSVSEAVEDDFSIDLEKEMMGEFDAGEDPVVAPALRSEAAESELDDAEFGDIELDLAADFDETPSAELPDVVVAPLQAAATDDADMDFDLDDAFFAAVEEDDAAAPEIAAVEAVEADAVLQSEPDQAPATEVDHASAVNVDHAPSIHVDHSSEADFPTADSVGDIELDLADDFDDELAASIVRETEAGWTDTQPVDDEPEPIVAAPEVAAEPVAEADMDAGLDAAMFESALDDAFDAVVSNEDGIHQGEAGVTPDFAAHSGEILPEDEELHFNLDDFDVVEDDAASTDATTLNHEAEPGSAMDDPLEAPLPIFPSRPVEYHQADAPDIAVPVGEEALEAADNSLEDELNALLGNISAASTAASAPVETKHETVPAQAAFEPTDHYTAEHRADPELDWDIGEADLLAVDEEIEAGEDFQPEAASYENDAEDDFDSGVHAPEMTHPQDDRWNVAPDDGRTGPDLIDDVPDFDHDDLDAAIANAMSHSAVRPDDSQAEWRPAPRHEGPREDPLDVIAALTAKYSATAEAHGSANTAGRRAFEDAPDVETIEVQDRAVALADDLDLPELAYEEEPSPVADYDDLDTEFASLLTDMNAADAAQEASSHRNGDAGYAQRRDETYAPVAAGHPTATHAAYDDDARGEYGYDDAARYGEEADADYPETEADEFEYGSDFDEAGPERNRDSAPPRRGMLIAAIVGGVAIVGGLGAFAMSFGGSGDDVPVLVRADDAPIKVKPENPGGTTVPNQDNKVYDTVAGTGSTDNPQQERLVTTAEEPVDVTPPAPEPELVELAPGEPAPKGEDRIEQILAEAEADLDTQVAAIAPRKVRTMVVKPDGTLVPREEPTPVEVVEPQAAAATEALAEPAPAAPAAVASAPEVVTGTPNFTPPAGEAAGALAPAQPDEVPAAQQAAFPDSVPIAPTRPSEQPVDVVGEVKPDQVAALSPAVTSGGNWSMQIASQPSEAAAQSSYQDLLGRYGSVLDGRQANIVKAEIAGKGTFWRVRVPAQSRNDAIGLCENYKAAGGNCFVSR